ncbi:MAG: HEAT repeat domain-containing protein, partial [Byssovorax sp.]
TFQEFFVAAGLHAKEDFESVARQHLFDPRWEEVIRLGVGYLALVQKRPMAAQRFVKRVLEHEEPEPRAWFTKLLKKQVPLAALLAAEAGDALPEALQQRVAGEMAAWVAVMPHELVGPVLKELALTDFAPRIAMACEPRIRSGIAEARARVASALGDLRVAGVEETLVGALSDESTAVGKAAALALHNFLSKELLQKIEPRLLDLRPEVRVAAIKALSPRAMDVSENLLQNLLQDPNESVRAAATRALIHLPHPDASKAASILQQNKSSEVHRALSEVFVYFVDTEWLKALISNEQAELRLYTAVATSTSTKPLGNVFDAPNDALVSLAGKFITPKWHSTKERIAALRSQDEHVRVGAAYWLNGVEAALEPLMALTSDASGLVRSNAIKALGRMSAERAIEACDEALRDTDTRVKFTAAVALARHKRDDALGPLLDGFFHDASTRAEAASALGQLGAKEALEPLMAAAQDPQEKQLKAICSAIGQLASSNEVDRLATYLEGHEQPSAYSDHIFTSLWTIATREARRTPEPTG